MEIQCPLVTGEGDVDPRPATVGARPQSSDPADFEIAQSAELLADGSLSSSELTEACLSRIEARDGAHSHDGDAASINAWVRVYADDARAAALAADQRLSRRRARDLGPAPTLCGVPIGLLDLIAAAGKPLTASSRVLDDAPRADGELWARLSAAGMVLLGHLHTHEFGAGTTCDQVGNPWSLERSAGGSSGGPAAALAARMVPAAVGCDTFGSLRIPSAFCATSGLKPTRGVLSIEGVVPLCPTFDHAGPMARTVADCALLFQAMNGRTDAGPLPELPLAGLRIGRSPRAADANLDIDVLETFESAVETCSALGATVVPVKAPTPMDVLDDYFNLFGEDVLAYHRQFVKLRDLYRPSVRELLEQSEHDPIGPGEAALAQARRREGLRAWRDWFVAEGVFALLEPTAGVVAPIRGAGYAHFGTQLRLASLTYYWNWIGFPVVSLPAGVGARSHLPVGVSLIGPTGADLELLRAGITLQGALGVPVPSRFPG